MYLPLLGGMTRGGGRGGRGSGRDGELLWEKGGEQELGRAREKALCGGVAEKGGGGGGGRGRG